MMTFTEWLDANPTAMVEHSDWCSRVFDHHSNLTQEQRAQLWNLSDMVVAGVRSGPSIVLTPRRMDADSLSLHPVSHTFYLPAN